MSADEKVMEDQEAVSVHRVACSCMQVRRYDHRWPVCPADPSWTLCYGICLGELDRLFWS